MPWETAKACIDYFYEHSVDADRVDLSFYGGEPFCNFDLIEKSTKYFDHLFCGKYKTYSMTINATLLNKKNLEFLDKFEFKLMISLDGNKKTNDKNRKFNNIDKSVYYNIIKNLKIEGKKVLFVLPESNKNVYLSARNLQRAEVILASNVNSYKVLNADVVVITEKSLETIDQILTK